MHPEDKLTENHQNEIEPTINEEEVLSHSDKLVGIYTAPSETFQKMSYEKPKHSDWLIPLAVILVVVIASFIIKMNNPEIKDKMMSAQVEKQEKAIDEMVKQGKLDPDKAEQQKESVNKMMTGPLAMVIGSLGIIVNYCLVFFVLAGIIFLFARFVFKGSGTYTHALIANSMTNYIAMIGVIIALILSIYMVKPFNDVNANNFAGLKGFGGFGLNLIDIFGIWANIVYIIGLKKLFKLDSAIGIGIVVFIIWILLKYVGYAFAS